MSEHLSLINKKKWNVLKKVFKNSSIPHAILISGVSLYDILINLFGNDFSLRNHPDIITISPLKKEITINQVKDCIWKLGLSPSIFNFKIAFIDKAHTMNQEAYSALLKTLEEPKGNAIIFLITDYPYSLPSTILSRVQKINFLPENRFVLDNRKAKEIEEIISFNINKKFKYIENLVNNGDVKNFLFNMLCYFAKNPEKNFKILKMINKLILLTEKTNINQRLALEVLMLDISNNIK
jgi:DNA polymerase III gamma/tau subunit